MPDMIAFLSANEPLNVDRQAAFVRAHERAVFAVASRMLRPRGLGAHVEDIAQEAFIRALRAAPRLQAQSNESAWLLTIVSRLCIDLMRRQSRRRKAAPHLPMRAIALDPERRVMTAQLSADLEAALGMLPPDQHAVLVLRVFEDMDYAQIASSLNLRVGTVKSRLSRARAALRAQLKAVGHG